MMLTTFFKLTTTRLMIKEIRRLLSDGSVSVSDIYEACLEKIKATAELNAFISVFPSNGNYDSESTKFHRHVKDSRKLAGIPIAVKDNFTMKDALTTCASHTLRTFISPYSATVVDRLVTEGAMVLGKTNLDEFAMGSGGTEGIFGPVANPWGYDWSHDSKMCNSKVDNKTKDQSKSRQQCDFYISGGSSSGSAVAVATGCVLAAIGSDTSGSTRLPASFCGVPALKPTYGLVSRHGLISLVNSMDVPGIVANNIDDIADILNVIAGWDPNDSTTVRDTYTPIDMFHYIDLKRTTVGLPKEIDSDSMLTSGARDHWLKTADILTNHGVSVRWISLPRLLDSLTCYQVLCSCEIASNFARYDGIEFGYRADNTESTESLFAQTRHESFNEVVRSRILAGNYFLLKQNYEDYFIHAAKVRRLITNDVNKVFDEGVDAILTPAATQDAPLYSQFTKEYTRDTTANLDRYLGMANLAGNPAVVVPVGLSEKGLPLAVQLISKAYSEQKLLSLAKVTEELANFTRLDLTFLDSEVKMKTLF